MAATGAWRKQRTWDDSPSPLGRPEYSEQHQKYDSSNTGSEPLYGSERRDLAPPNVVDPGTAYDPVLPSQAPGITLDMEPISHDDSIAGGGAQTLYQAQRAANRARSDDRGAVRRQMYRLPMMGREDEKRSTVALTVEPIEAGSRAAITRGANSLPENNPDGFRPGLRIQRYSDRRIWQRQRFHDLRPIRNFTAAAAVDSPPLETSNRITSPFGWNKLSYRNRGQTPMQRRVPRAWDESASTDGVTAEAADYPPSGYQSWGL